MPSRETQVLATYSVIAENVPGVVKIVKNPREYSVIYEIVFPQISIGTEAVLASIREKLIEDVKVNISEILDPKAADDIKKRFLEGTKVLIAKELPRSSEQERDAMAGHLIHEMLGLGKMEVLINDDNLEEIVVNNSTEPLWVYHKKFGWLKTNVIIPTEDQIYNYATVVGRKVGRSITNLDPLMDAHLTTGDRVNATLFPISTKGNTITIRKFRREPWTMVNFISPEDKTISKEVAALIWIAMQYELNILFSGGTATGKTSILNAALAFIPPTHRVISIEDTRELNLPKFLHWVPLVTRTPNPEGKGEVSMLDLLVNSLRMRPDRVVLGEVRRENEAEVLFEAMHTGHSVYATVHADRAEQVVRRLTNPPINIPELLLESLHMVVVQFRHRRLGIRRTFQVAEIVPTETHPRVDVIYQWNPKNDSIQRVKRSKRLWEEISLHTGMTHSEIEKDLKEKQQVLQWMLEHKVDKVNPVGKIIADYYKDRDAIMKVVKANKTPADILGPALMAELKKEQQQGA